MPKFAIKFLVARLQHSGCQVPKYKSQPTYQWDTEEYGKNVIDIFFSIWSP